MTWLDEQAERERQIKLGQEVLDQRLRRSGNNSATPGETCWPQAMDPCAYYGIAGKAVTAIEPHTESDPVALLVQVLTAFGVLVGRTPYVQVEGDRHYANLFELLTGETSIGRKGTSWGRVRSIFERDSEWPRVVSGLSSGEGLAGARSAERNGEGQEVWRDKDGSCRRRRERQAPAGHRA